jgi:preprotein translocase subunit SecY
VVYDTGLFAIVVMILTMTAGTSIIMWFGELITDRGIGNGMSILIFTQIAAQFPSAMWSIRTASPGNKGLVVFILVLAVGLLVMAGVVFVEQAQRRIPVQYAKRMVGNRLLGGSTTYIPLKVNQAGVIPVIFASSILYLPVLYTMFNSQGRIAEWITINLSGSGQSVWYNVIYLTLIIFFTYFYVAITFDPVEVSDNMKKYGGFIPGIRAGKPTEDYLAYVLSRLTAPGALYLALISLLPTLAMVYLGANQNFPFGGTSILIIVGVGLDTVKQIEGQLQQRSYEGFLK